MKKTRLLAGLLALAALTCSFAACGDPAEDTGDGDRTVGEEVTDELRDNLPDELDYGQDEVTIISRDREGYTSGELYVEKLTNEPVNDAVYERNRVVEDRLGVTLVNILDSDQDPNIVITKVKNAVNANTDEYDLVATPCYVTLSESLGGIFADLRSTQYLDLDQPWWSQGFNDVVEYQGTQYAATGSALLSTYRFAFVTLFNKRLFDNAQQEYLYTAVENNTWTLDYQAELLTNFHQDDGDGIKEAEGDIYGLATGNYISVDPYWSSCKVPILEKDEDGYYYLAFDKEKLYLVAEKVIGILKDESTYNFKSEAMNGEQDSIRKMFASGYAAMATLRLMELESADTRDMTDQYGVVPMPKFDEAQDGYRTLLHDEFTVLAIPTTVEGDRLDEVSAVMEAMASEGYRTVKPAYYESALRYKYMKDPQSWDMMNIIIDNIYIDAGIIYTIADFHNTFRLICGSGKNTVANEYVSVQMNATRKLNDDLLARLDALLD